MSELITVERIAILRDSDVYSYELGVSRLLDSPNGSLWYKGCHQCAHGVSDIDCCELNDWQARTNLSLTLKLTD